jgi:hypothetical protein
VPGLCEEKVGRGVTGYPVTGEKYIQEPGTASWGSPKFERVKYDESRGTRTREILGRKLVADPRLVPDHKTDGRLTVGRNIT